MQSLINSSVKDISYQSFIPVYGSYYSYKQKSDKIQKKINLLQHICCDISKTIKENNYSKKLDDTSIEELTNRFTKICKKIDSLKIKKFVVEQQYKISLGAEVLSPIASMVAPGSSVLVGIGSSVLQAAVHNAKTEETGERSKSLLKTATVSCAKTAGKKILKASAEVLLDS